MLGVDEIILLGGESTLHPFFTELIQIIETKKISTRLFTNGTYNYRKAGLILRNEYINTIFFHYDENYLKDQNNRETFLRNLEEASLYNKKI